MNLFKLYFNLVALQSQLMTQYWDGFIRGMDDTNRQFAEEMKNSPYAQFTNMYKDYNK